MTVADIEDLILFYQKASERRSAGRGVKFVGIELALYTPHRASVSTQWRASFHAHRSHEAVVFSALDSMGDSPGDALGKGYAAFGDKLDAYLAKQAKADKAGEGSE